MGVCVRVVVLFTAALLISVGAGGANAQSVTFSGMSGPSLAAEATVQSITDNSTSDKVTVSGGALLTAETWLPANRSTVYFDSFLLSSPTTSTITITFAQAVTGFSVDLYNGQVVTDSFSISNGLGTTVNESIGPNTRDGMALVSIPEGGTVFTITDLDARGYDFSIDTISYTLAGPLSGGLGPVAGGGAGDPLGGPGGSSAPEPIAWALMIVGLSSVGAAVRRPRHEPA